MARKITITEKEIQSILTDLYETLTKTKWQGRISINRDVESDERKAILKITPKAWLKMKALVDDFTTEVEWHGLCRRISEFEFEVFDIMVFPHEAGSVTVTSDQAEYEEWLDSIDDETFQYLRFHGHSHVRMGVSPSGDDMTYRNSVLSNFPKANAENDVFYVFLIMNKSDEISGQIYDLTNNAIYDTYKKDLNVVVDIGESLEEFIAGARKIVRTVYSYTTSSKKTKKNNDKSTRKSSVCSSSSYLPDSCENGSDDIDKYIDGLYDMYGESWYQHF